MTDPTGLVAAQTQRHTSLDPLLPPTTVPDRGDMLVATLARGTQVAGLLDIRTERGRRVWALTPLLGDHGGEGMEAVLRALRARLDRTPVPADSVCTLAWPSLDADCTRPLLDHGLVPVLALGVRVGATPRNPSGAASVAVRRSSSRDAGAVARLVRRAEPSQRCSSLVPKSFLDGTSPGSEWMAESGSRTGEPLAGMMRLGEAHRRTPGFAGLLPEGNWGWIVRLLVDPRKRGRGVGGALVAAAHDVFARRGLERSLAWYNPLDSPAAAFWHRQGYRPLWTVWQCEPASALR